MTTESLWNRFTGGGDELEQVRQWALQHVRREQVALRAAGLNFGESFPIAAAANSATVAGAMLAAALEFRAFDDVTGLVFNIVTVPVGTAPHVRVFVADRTGLVVAISDDVGAALAQASTGFYEVAFSLNAKVSSPHYTVDVRDAHLGELLPEGSDLFYAGLWVSGSYATTQLKVATGAAGAGQLGAIGGALPRFVAATPSGDLAWGDTVPLGAASSALWVGAYH